MWVRERLQAHRVYRPGVATAQPKSLPDSPVTQPPTEILHQQIHFSPQPSTAPRRLLSPLLFEMPLRRLLGLSAAAAASGLLCRGFSAAAWRPPWAMIENFVVVNPQPPRPRVSLRIGEPPCASLLIVPGHLVYKPRGPDPVTRELSVAFGGFVKAASGDGLLLLTFFELIGTAASATRGGAPELKLTDLSMNPDVTRFVCNPMSGELFRLPDIDGTKKTMWFSDIGILTQSERPDGPPDRYAVAVLGHDGTEISFVMRRFLSETGRWDKLGLHSPLPLSRRMDMDIPHEAVAFAGRLWWFDVTWGALSLDPFSDQPELRFVELPRGSVTEPVDKERRRELVKYRRMGVSEGRLRYVEVLQEEPFTLSSFALDDDGRSWKLEHRIELRRVWRNEDLSKLEP
ncbi:hypothetical protein PR202_ga05406 [Eleusine coracana subsp. coracana]|uniref:DUF1618 domain-containing protein n=1 Tax=Eleusine coracana subsp. coracana TaxID=191504 RepID=A0AAV5BTD5_ELECO|nr:hypothetical protein QOZ80_5AG0370120 [Eleusine coracana subsp. coracana]GJM88836.1 hypothetical protein PR202_ga04953 [Eleusine coracana subsp. coracana]GJM89237.1 hypothetical protein PR202_ga05406 [Eleusine coracana subsp. coracana]